MRDAEKTIGTMIDRQKVCFIGSVDADGFPNVKAMLRPRKRNGITEIWFSTNTSSLKVQSFRNNPKACVYFCDKRFFRGAMLRGTVEILEDAASRTSGLSPSGGSRNSTRAILPRLCYI